MLCCPRLSLPSIDTRRIPQTWGYALKIQRTECSLWKCPLCCLHPQSITSGATLCYIVPVRAMSHECAVKKNNPPYQEDCDSLIKFWKLLLLRTTTFYSNILVPRRKTITIFCIIIIKYFSKKILFESITITNFNFNQFHYKINFIIITQISSSWCTYSRAYVRLML